MSKVRVRIPPSPTGLLHIGTVRTALYNYLFAKHHGGTMVFRIEDTDKERGTKEFEKDIIDGLVKLGIAGDEGVHISGSKGYRQSERTDIYTAYLKQLLAKDKAYFCDCTKERLEAMRKEQEAKKQAPRYDGTCAKKKLTQGVIRLRIPADRGDIKWNDLVRGEIVINVKELDDFVIARLSDDPLYNLTVVADDHDMKITHVIRGEDHISNTPKQILIFEAFGWKAPEYAHLPLILNEDRSKLSKRKNKVSVSDYLAEGYLPQALLNFLALLGWNTPDEQEIFTMDELIQKFTLERVHKGGAVFDLKKLDWINGEYIKLGIREKIDCIYEAAKPFLDKMMPGADPVLVKTILKDPDFEGRFKKLSEIPEGLAPLFLPLPDYPLELIAREKFQITPAILKQVLEKAIEVVKALEWRKGDSEKSEVISAAFAGIVDTLKLKNGQVLWPIRVALSGLEKSPNYATLATYLGKEEVLKRFQSALQKL